MAIITPTDVFYHWILYGESGSGKSTTASTWPKPMIVFCFDPYGKEQPYLRRGAALGELMQPEGGVPYQDVYNKKGEVIIRVEHYLDADPDDPKAYRVFRARMAVFHTEYETWRTAVVDSVTFMELAARKYEEKVLNPMPSGRSIAAKGEGFDIRKWWAGSTNALEEMLMMRFGSLPMNVVVCCHVDEVQDIVEGTMVRNPNAPGRLRKNLAAGFSELYRTFITRNDEGQRVYLMQTQGDNRYNAASQIEPPDPCEPHYAALFSNV